jgi:hypothetical protein
VFSFSRAGKILKDEQTLAESGVKDKEFIVVMVTKVCVGQLVLSAVDFV